MQKQKQTKTDKAPIANESEKVIISWEAPEYIQHEKNKKWYLIAGAVVLIVAIIAALTDNITLALAVFVFAGVYYYMQTKHPPGKITVRIAEMGIYAGDMYFPYQSIKAFWIINEHGIKTLNLRVINRYHSDVVIQFDGQDPAQVRNFLIGRIPEWEGKHVSATDIFLRLLKL